MSDKLVCLGQAAIICHKQIKSKSNLASCSNLQNNWQHLAKELKGNDFTDGSCGRDHVNWPFANVITYADIIAICNRTVELKTTVTLHSVFYKDTLYKNTEARFAKKYKNATKKCSASDEKSRKEELDFVIEQCDFLKEAITNTQLSTFFWQANSDEVVDIYQQSLHNFQQWPR